MINNFLKLYNPINIVMIISNNKAFKNKKLLILKEEIKFLINTLKLLKHLLKLQINYKKKLILLYIILFLWYIIYIIALINLKKN
jgi:hypothetical protein